MDQEVFEVGQYVNVSLPDGHEDEDKEWYKPGKRWGSIVAQVIEIDLDNRLYTLSVCILGNYYRAKVSFDYCQKIGLN